MVGARAPLDPRTKSCIVDYVSNPHRLDPPMYTMQGIARRNENERRTQRNAHHGLIHGTHAARLKSHRTAPESSTGALTVTMIAANLVATIALVYGPTVADTVRDEWHAARPDGIAAVVAYWVDLLAALEERFTVADQPWGVSA